MANKIVFKWIMSVFHFCDFVREMEQMGHYKKGLCRAPFLKSVTKSTILRHDINKAIKAI